MAAHRPHRRHSNGSSKAVVPTFNDGATGCVIVLMPYIKDFPYEPNDVMSKLEFPIGAGAGSISPYDKWTDPRDCRVGNWINQTHLFPEKYIARSSFYTVEPWMMEIVEDRKLFAFGGI